MATPQMYIAEGFLEDCKELIQFLTTNYEKVDWHKFCYYWKQMQFDIIFYGRQSGPEVVELTEELLQIARLYMVTETDNFEDQVIGVFIAYAITVIQPYKNLCSLRLIHEDVEALKKIEDIARRDKRIDVLMTLGKLYIYGKTQFHVSLRERAMDITIRKYFDGSTKVPTSIARYWNGKINMQDINECEDISRFENNYLDLKIRAREVTKNAGAGTKVLIDTFKPKAKALVDSLRKLITEPDKDKPEEEIYDANTVKQKAMKKTVNSMRHLNGLAERKKAGEEVPPKSYTNAKSRKRCRQLPSPEPERMPYNGNSLPDLSDLMVPDNTPDGPELRREGSPEELFRGFTRQEINISNPTEMPDDTELDYEPTSDGNVTGKGKRKGNSYKTKAPSFYVNTTNKGRSPKGYGSKMYTNVNSETQKNKMRMIKNRDNRKLRLSNDFNVDDVNIFLSDSNSSSDESDEPDKIKKAHDVSTNSDAEAEKLAVIQKAPSVASDSVETCKGKEFVIQTKGIVKHFVEFEVSDIVIRTEKGVLPEKDIEIEYIDNFSGANAQLHNKDRNTNAFEEICEVSDDEETKKEKYKVESDGGSKDDYEVQVVVEECDEFGNEKQDDSLEMFQVINEDATDTVDTTFQTFRQAKIAKRTGSGRKENYSESSQTVGDTSEEETLRKILNKHRTQGTIDRRKLKQPNLRSKWKKMGLLPVANFDEDSNSG